MLGVDEAIERIAGAFAPLTEHERIPLLDAQGRILVEDIPADIDLPPFDNSAMDGYAVRAGDLTGASRERPVALRVLGEIAAGMVAPGPVGRGEAYRILTGAAMPAGADAVVPYELTDGRGFGGWDGAAGVRLAAQEREVRVFEPVERGDNVRYRGEVVTRGAVVLRAGTLVRAGEIATLASVGRAQVWVHRWPRVAILSTGDELVPVEAVPEAGKIRDGNGIALAALVRQYGGEVVLSGVAPDRPEAIRGQLLQGIEAGADLLITSGGVSMGDYDVVKRVLLDEGTVAFWSIDVRPGKPLAFGSLCGVPLLGLPGNPVSALVTFELFARPAVLRLAGHRRWSKVEILATAIERFENTSGRENFLRAVVERRSSAAGAVEWVVRLTGAQGSNVITSMARANALVRVPKERTVVHPGETVRALMLDWPSLW